MLFTAILFILPILLPAGPDDAATSYLAEVEHRVIAVWKLPPKSDGLKVTLRYKLARDGSVSSVRVEKTSGNQSFDNSAIQAVHRASPFPRPPKSFPVGDLRLVLQPTLTTPQKKDPMPLLEPTEIPLHEI